MYFSFIDGSICKILAFWGKKIKIFEILFFITAIARNLHILTVPSQSNLNKF
jgi:hypothetical protein